MDNADGLTLLLDLHGEIFEVSPHGHWVKFIAYRVPATEGVPHGISYSLTFHNRRGDRLLGFDNAHPLESVPPNDHRHFGLDDKGRRYRFESAEQLLSDFWATVDQCLKEMEND